MSACIYVDACAPAGGDGTSWAGAFDTLQEALAVAISGDEIQVATGVYRPDRFVDNAGDPAAAIMQEPMPNGGIVNMGAYGGTAEASKSWFGGPDCRVIITGDLNGDCVVNLADVALMAVHWLEDRR
jgi:hypothetical protein